MKDILEKYYMEGLLYKQVHPTLPLIIWNYTEKVQYEGLWDEITIQTRGLVTDNEGSVIARPFKKFFNLEEGKFTSTPNFEVYEKMDGSLGILFWYNGNWVMATRGSFTSDQSIKGRQIMDSKYNIQPLLKGYTTLVEIIYPENRIVCDYGGEEKLVVLGMINTASGKEMDYDSMIMVHNETKMPVVKKYDGINDFNSLKGKVNKNDEGFVVRFTNGERIKIKGEEYLRLHKIMTNVSTTSVWETLSSGDNLDNLLKDVPDEFYKKIKDYSTLLKNAYNSIESESNKKFNDRQMVFSDRKSYSEWVKTQPTYLHGILFKMLDQKPYSDIIWKLIKPEFKKL